MLKEERALIEVIDLTKKYGANTVVNHLNFKVESGKIYGFLGPNGAGKSTTMNMITGCLASTEGTVIVDGHDIFEEPIEAKRLIGYLPEQPPLYQDMTPYEYLTFVAGAKGVERGRVHDEVMSAMEETGITSMQNRLIRNLSKGYRQRVGISQALLGNPELIILDEPTVGLDPKQIIEIRDLIRSLGENRTVMISSHILAEISEICDYVMVINHGNLVASDTLENIRAQFTSENIIHMTVRGTKEIISGVLGGIDGILDTEIKPSDEYDGCCDIRIETEQGKDLREEIVSALVRGDCGVKRLNVEAPSLEEIFIKLTSDTIGAEDYDESDDEDESDGTPDSQTAEGDALSDETDSADDDHAENEGGKVSGAESGSGAGDAEGGEDDYVPMFRIKDREDDE